MAAVPKLSDVEPDQLIQRAIDMRPMIASAADETERNRQVAQEIIDHVRNGDFFGFTCRKKFGRLNSIAPATEFPWNGRPPTSRPDGVWPRYRPPVAGCAVSGRYTR